MTRRLLPMLILVTGLLPTAAETQSDTPSLPDRNPERMGAPARQAPPPPSEVAAIPWNDAEIAAERAKCSEALSLHRHEGRVSALLAAASYVNFSRRRTPVSEDDHVPKYQNVT
jgi:hypothetical protein